jgi:hypothetical protein
MTLIRLNTWIPRALAALLSSEVTDIQDGPVGKLTPPVAGSL